ncbi:hypothetical protein [Streptomyces sp. NPDC048385]|uniref:hypothetical protein n=1 Tax=unclassified Streptomyces TaxID=2593676 RepID=UPI0034386E16
MGILLLEMTDGSEMILTAGRAARAESGDVTFEYVDARYARRVGEDGVARWVPQLSAGRWWAY